MVSQRFAWQSGFPQRPLVDDAKEAEHLRTDTGEPSEFFFVVDDNDLELTFFLTRYLCEAHIYAIHYEPHEHLHQ